MSCKSSKKRGRGQLSSSESEDITRDLREIRSSIANINDKLQSLDLLHKLSNDVEELKQSLDFQTALVDVLKQENATLRAEVNSLRHQSDEIQNTYFKIKQDILDLQCRSMRNNIVIHGVPEIQGETFQKTENLVKTFLASHLRMDEAAVQNIGFGRVHRIGQKHEGHSIRPIVAQFLDPKSKSMVMERGKELKGTKFSMNDQFPAEIVKRRRLLFPIMKDAKKSNKRVRLTVDRLYIDGLLYRNASVTYWLSGGDDKI